jgi:tetrapyrrole methylase family protein/MazG family protein
VSSTPEASDAAAAFGRFVAIVKALRTPGTGCPWDLEQDHRSLRRYLLEETCETLDALDRGSDPDLCEELGDLLLQIVLHAQVAADRQAFTIADVANGIAEKMVRRHPHVFGGATARDSAEVLVNWERIKAEEKPTSKRESIERLPADLSAIHRAQRVLDKLREEVKVDDAFASVQAALAELLMHRDQLERRLGDVLLGVCRLARGLGMDADCALRERTRQLVDERLADQQRQ